MVTFENAKNGIWSKKICREIDLFDFTSFFGLDFFKFSALLFVQSLKHRCCEPSACMIHPPSYRYVHILTFACQLYIHYLCHCVITHLFTTYLELFRHFKIIAGNGGEPFMKINLICTYLLANRYLKN